MHTETRADPRQEYNGHNKTTNWNLTAHPTTVQNVYAPETEF